MFTKLGRDEVLMARYMHKDVLAISTQGWIQGRDVTIIDINRLSVAKASRFSIIDSQISLSIVFDIDNMW